MKMFPGWVISAGLAVAATSAQAQVTVSEVVVSSPYIATSDISGPYAGGRSVRGAYATLPPEARVPGEGAPYGGPRLLPPPEVYTVVREGGFSPLGAPRQRGVFYTIAVINRGGDDGRLLIDARDGRIVRFVPAYRIGDNVDRGMPVAYGPARLPPMNASRGVPRPPASIPHVASRTPSSVPLPRAMPPHHGEPKPVAAKPAPAPAQQSAAIQAKPPEASPPPPAPAAAAPVEAKPAAPQILPTQEMPKVQGLE